jgi:diguanylate cyclase (GGDEF)-like protein/PAS domain S-box-containing protein
LLILLAAALRAPVLWAQDGMAGEGGYLLAVNILVMLALVGVAGFLFVQSQRLRRKNARYRADAASLAEDRRFFTQGQVATLALSMDPSCPILAASDNLASVLGVAPDRLKVGCCYADILAPDESARLLAGIERHVAQGDTQWRQQYCVHTEHEGSRWIGAHTQAEFDQHGKVLRLRSYLYDDTRRMEADLRMELLASVFDHTNECICMTDPTGTILEVNQNFCKVTGYSYREVIGKNPRILKSDRHDYAFYRAMWDDLAARGQWQGEIWNQRKNGEIYPEHLSITSVHARGGQVSHYIGIFTDISDFKAQQQRIERLAHFDALTGLPNRVLLTDRLRIALAAAKRAKSLLAIAYLDLDGFKLVNDTYGHETGDMLLISVARSLEDILRETDTVARLGGDEFVLVLGGGGERADYLNTLERVLARLSSPFSLGMETVTIGASIGVTFYPGDDGDPDSFLRHADQAMYQAKQAGRSSYKIFAEEEMAQSALHPEDLACVESALEKGEFCLYFQPTVNIREGRVAGMEGRLYWQHPRRGLLSPAEFMPDFVGTEMEMRLCEWFVSALFTQFNDWRQQGLRFSVSFSVTNAQLRAPQFLSHLLAMMQLYAPLPAGAVSIELQAASPEQEEIAEMAQILEECRKHGITIVLGDFGTGYSSLACLRRLPADFLKLDQSFIRDMLENPEDMAIIEGVLNMASAFKRQVIAEGVESAAHCSMLLHMGCNIVRGSYIARPMSGNAIVDWLREWRPDPAWPAAAQLQLGRRHLPLLMMEVELRRWIEQMREHALVRAGQRTEQRPDAPVLDADACPFTRWYQIAKKSDIYTSIPSFKALRGAHDHLHSIAQAMAAAIERDQPEEADVRVESFNATSDQTMSLLNNLMEMAAELPDR